MLPEGLHRGKGCPLIACLHLPDDLPRLIASAAWRRGNLLDLRDGPAFARGHLAGSASIPLEPMLAAAHHAPAAVLADALPSIFLPPRHEALAVILERADLATAVAEALAARGRGEVAPVVLPGGPDVVLPDAVRGTGPSSRVLWRPPEFLARWAHLLPPPVAGPVLDVAMRQRPRRRLARAARLPRHRYRSPARGAGPGAAVGREPGRAGGSGASGSASTRRVAAWPVGRGGVLPVPAAGFLARVARSPVTRRRRDGADVPSREQLQRQPPTSTPARAWRVAGSAAAAAVHAPGAYRGP